MYNLNTEISPLHPVLEINTNSDGIKVQKHGDNKIRCICSVNDDNGKCSIVNNSDNNDEGDGINRNNNKVNNSDGDGDDTNKNNNDAIIDNIPCICFTRRKEE